MLQDTFRVKVNHVTGESMILFTGLVENVLIVLGFFPFKTERIKYAASILVKTFIYVMYYTNL